MIVLFTLQIIVKCSASRIKCTVPSCTIIKISALKLSFFFISKGEEKRLLFLYLFLLWYTVYDHSLNRYNFMQLICNNYSM
jgi:hypothetical protein